MNPITIGIKPPTKQQKTDKVLFTANLLLKEGQSEFDISNKLVKIFKIPEARAKKLLRSLVGK